MCGDDVLEPFYGSFCNNLPIGQFDFCNVSRLAQTGKIVNFR